MLEEEDQEEPTDRGEEVYQEALGAVRVVPIGQTEAVELENPWRLPGEPFQGLIRRQVTRVQVILRTE